MSPLRSKPQRGYSVAELISGIFVFGILSTFVAIIIIPLMGAPNSQQAKIDTVQTGAQALYRLQRDIREGQVNGVYVCTYPASSVCATPQPAPNITSVQVVAILTPRLNGNGNIQWDSTAGTPTWQGFQVYWLVPDNSGNGTYNLEYAFSQSTGFQPGSIASGADTAVNSAFAGTATIVAHNINTLNIDQNVNGKTIGLSLSAQSTDGNKVNETSYTGDAFARN